MSVNRNFSDENTSENSYENEDDKLLFSKLFPAVSLENVLKDENFALFRRTKGKNALISALYSDYTELVRKISYDAVEKAVFSMQNTASSPGSLSTVPNTDVFFTKEQVMRMNREEIKKNYDKIRESQQNW